MNRSHEKLLKSVSAAFVCAPLNPSTHSLSLALQKYFQCALNACNRLWAMPGFGGSSRFFASDFADSLAFGFSRRWLLNEAGLEY